MKKIALYGLLAVSLLAAEPALAQKSKVTTAVISMRNGDFVKAKEAINEAANNEATKADPKTWLYRGQIYRAIYDNPKLRETEPNALQEAHSSIVKGLELDVNKKNASDLNAELRDLALVYYDEGSAAYNSQNYELAYKNFDIYLTSLNKLDEANRKKIEKLLTDNKINPTAAKLYAAYSAQQIKNNEKAISYYNELVNAKYDDILVYMSLSDLYKAAGDTSAAIAILDKGMGNVTDKKSLLIDKLNIYISRGQTQEALKLGQEALALDPKNTSLYIALGNIYDNLKMGKEAEELYNKALALNPEDYGTNYSLGMSFFNQGADKYNESIKEKNLKKSEEQLNSAKDRFRKAIPYLEKAHAQKPAEKDVIQVLAEIHAKLDDFDKSKMYRDKLKK